MLRPVWEAQMEATRGLVQRLAQQLRTRLDPEPPPPPHEPVPEAGTYDEAVAS